MLFVKSSGFQYNKRLYIPNKAAESRPGSRQRQSRRRKSMEGFFVIAGLGNPGRKYDGSRHNVGFDVIDELVDRYHINNPEHFGKCQISY